MDKQYMQVSHNIMDNFAFRASLFHKFLIVVSLVLGCYTTGIGAQGLMIEPMLQDADFIFEGTVVDVQHRFSTKSTEEDPEPLPYSFVSFSVNQVIKGNYEDSIVTLRFVGGPIDENNIHVVPNQSRFDVGDNDVLLVKNNNQSGCPLVGCMQGRFRYLDGFVTTERGQMIRIDDNGSVLIGSKVDSEEVRFHEVSENISIASMKLSEEDMQAEQNAHSDIDGIPLTDPASFTLYIQSQVNETHTSEQLHNLPPFETADPDQLFFGDIDIKPVDYSLQKVEPTPPLPLDEFPKKQSHEESDEHTQAISDFKIENSISKEAGDTGPNVVSVPLPKKKIFIGLFLLSGLLLVWAYFYLKRKNQRVIP